MQSFLTLYTCIIINAHFYCVRTCMGLSITLKAGVKLLSGWLWGAVAHDQWSEHLQVI